MLVEDSELFIHAVAANQARAKQSSVATKLEFCY